MFQQDGTFVQYFIPYKQLYMFRMKHSPIVRSSNKLWVQLLVVTDSMWPSVVVGEFRHYQMLYLQFIRAPDDGW
jgi:hypothetical protein